MDENKEGQELQQIPEATPTAEEGGEQTPESTVTPEMIAELKKKADVSSQNFERAKKAEADAKRLKEQLKQMEDTKAKEPMLTPKDTIALINAKVDTEDFDEVVGWATYRKIPIAEAIKDKTLKTILRERAEERQSAQATNTRGGARGSSKPTAESVLAEVETRNQLPTSDEAIEALAAARMERKVKNAKK